MQKQTFGATVSAADAELESMVSRIANKDRDALAEFYEATKSSVYGFAFSLLKRRSDAEDVSQDVYLHVWRNADKYKAEGRPMAWLIVITRNLALDKLRSAGRLVSFDSRREAAAESGSNEDRLTLRSLLEKLSDEERQIVVMHAVTGLRHREIAEILKKPLSTVLSKYSRAIKKLRIAWKEEN